MLEWAMIGAAMAGTFVHWVHEKYEGRTAGNPIDYLITHPWHTLTMFGATFATCGTMIMTGQLASASLTTAIVMGFTVGYTADSALNKGPNK